MTEGKVLTQKLRNIIDRPFPLQQEWAELDGIEAYARAKTLHTRLTEATEALEAADLDVMREKIANVIVANENVRKKLVEIREAHEETLGRVAHWSFVYGTLAGMLIVVIAGGITLWMTMNS